MKYKRIVSIGAHPLDAELMGGPLMIKYNKEAKCTFVHVTSSRIVDPKVSDEEKKAYKEKTDKESKQAAKDMGCECYLMGYASSELPSVSEFTNIIADYLRKENVDLVITHNRGTLHPRHYYTYECVTAACRKLRAEGININLLYGENCEDLSGFTPTCYVSIDDKIVDTWFLALKNYTLFGGSVYSVPYFDYYNTQLKVRQIEAGSKLKVKAYMHGALIDNE